MQLNPIDEALPIIAEAVAEWKDVHTPEKIKEKITRLLDENSEEITMKLLGFNNRSWDSKWELDHCNGRSGNSMAGDYMKSTQMEAITEWLSKVAMPKLSEKVSLRLKKEMQNEYDHLMSRAIREAVQTKVNQDVASVTNSLVESVQIHNYVKAMKLINGE